MNKNRMDEISRIWRSFVEKVSIEGEKESVSDLCKIGNTTWKRNMVFGRKKSGVIKKN